MYRLGTWLTARYPHLARWGGALVALLAGLALVRLARGGFWWVLTPVAFLSGLPHAWRLPRPQRDWVIALYLLLTLLPGAIWHLPGLVGWGFVYLAGVLLGLELRRLTR